MRSSIADISSRICCFMSYTDLGFILLYSGILLFLHASSSFLSFLPLASRVCSDGNDSSLDNDYSD